MKHKIAFLISFFFELLSFAQAQQNSSLAYFNYDKKQDSLSYKDTNCAITFKDFQFKSYFNQDSSIHYDAEKKEFSVSLDNYLMVGPWPAMEEKITIAFNDDIPYVIYDGIKLLPDTLKSDLITNNYLTTFDLWINKGMFLKIIFNHSTLSQIYFSDRKKIGKIFLTKKRNGIGYEWSYFERFGRSEVQFIISNNALNEPELIHYYNPAEKRGFYLPSFQKPNNFTKVYECHNNLAQDVYTDDSNVILNLKGNSMKIKDLDVLNWQYQVFQILRLAGEKSPTKNGVPIYNVQKK
jgi:hypothetical protein